MHDGGGITPQHLAPAGEKKRFGLSARVEIRTRRVSVDSHLPRSGAVGLKRRRAGGPQRERQRRRRRGKCIDSAPVHTRDRRLTGHEGIVQPERRVHVLHGWDVLDVVAVLSGSVIAYELGDEIDQTRAIATERRRVKQQRMQTLAETDQHRRP